MEPKTYRVRLVRPVFQAALVEVEAVGEQEAIFATFAQSGTIPDEEWVGKFDPDSYFCDAQFVDEAGDGDDYIFTEVDAYRKYLLLKANTDSGEGELLLQPWMDGITELMLADLSSDWSGELAELAEEGVSRFVESLERQKRLLNKTPAKVIPFRRPENSGGD